MKKTQPSKTSKARNKPTLVAFLLDRTGSMASCLDETIGGFNGYIKELRKKSNGTMKFTLTQFDSISVDIIHDGVPLKDVKLLNDDTYQPRAATPLYDAIGKTIRATEKSAGDKYKVLFVTLTDGLENASTTWTVESVRDLIKEMEQKNKWTFAHIGVGADGWDSTKAYSAGTQSYSNMLHIDKKDVKRSFARAAGQTVCYAASIGSSDKVVTGFWGKDDSKSD